MKAALRAVAGRLGYEIRRKGPEAAPAKLGYLDAQKTVSEASEAGLPVNLYLARKWKSEGLVDLALDCFAERGVFDRPNPRVVEIGSGSGSHLERIVARYAPAAYEVYETNEGWRDWLAATFPGITAHDADGLTMHQTADGSADLVLSLGTFVYLPFLVACRYWREACRIVAPGGFVVFDILSESCFTPELLDHWLTEGGAYPVFQSRAFVEHLMAQHGLESVAAYQRRYAYAKSEVLIFRRP